MAAALQPRLQAYIDLLHRGLMLLRNYTYAGNVALRRIEADHLHNIPTLLYEGNEHRHDYYIRGERGVTPVLCTAPFTGRCSTCGR
jgi:hypothetical protein